MVSPHKTSPTKIWIRLEELAMQYLKSIIDEAYVIQETLTEPSKDGGYDGELMIYLSSDGKLEHKILMEAKIRSSSSVSLNDFSKAVIISFNRAAKSLYLFTNSKFSPQLIEELNTFKNKINLHIEYIDGDELSDFIQQNPALANTYEEEFLRLFRKTAPLTDSVAKAANHRGPNKETPVKVAPSPSITAKKTVTLFCGKEYIDGSKALSKLLGYSNLQLFVIKGFPGSGRTSFIRAALKQIARPYFICDIDLYECSTIRIFFIRVLESIYGRNLSNLFIPEEVDKTVKQLFGELNAKQTSEDDLMVLNHIFTVENNDLIKHQDMYMFSLGNILCDLLNMYKDTSLFIFHFQNIGQAKSEVLNFMNQIIAKTKQTTAKVIVESSDMEATLVQSDSISARPQEYTLPGFKKEDIAECVNLVFPHESQPIRLMLTTRIQRSQQFLPFDVFNYLSYVQNRITAGEDIFKTLDEIEVYTSFGNGNWISILIQRYAQDRYMMECFALAALLNGRLKISLLEQLFSSRTDADLLIEKLSENHLFEFKQGYFQTKNQRYLTEISFTVSELARYKAAKLLLDNIDDVEEDYQAQILVRFRLLKICGRFQEMLDIYPQIYDILLSENQNRTALEYLKDCEDACSRSAQTRDDQIFVDILLKKLECFYNLYMYQQEVYNTTLKELETILNLSKNFRHERIQFLYYKWKASFSRGDYSNALTIAKQCVQAENELDVPLDHSISGKSYVAWALTIKEAEGYPEALALFNEGLTKYPQSLWLRVEYHSHVACMNLHKAPLNSVAHYKNILALTEHTKFSFRDVLHVRIDIAMALFYTNQYEEALLYAEEAMGIADSLDFANEKGRALNIIGCCKMATNQPEEAEVYFKESEYLLKKCGAYIYKWRPLVNLINIYHQRDDVTAIETVFHELKNDYWQMFVRKMNEGRHQDKLYLSFRYMLKIIQSKLPSIYNEFQSEIKNAEFAKQMDEMQDIYDLGLNLSHVCENQSKVVAILG